MNEMNRPLVTEEPIEFENEPVEVKDFRIPIDHSRGTCKICLQVVKETERSQHVAKWTWKH